MNVDDDWLDVTRIAEEFERLLDSPAAPASGEFAWLAEVLAAATAPTEAGSQPGEQAARAAFRALVPAPVNRRERGTPPIARWKKIKLAVVAATGAFALAGGVAAAATGSLPDGAQRIVKDLLGTFGVGVPGPPQRSGQHPGGPGELGNPAVPASSGVRSSYPHPSTTGPDHAVQNSTGVSDGHNRAGQHGSPTATPTTRSAATTRPTPTSTARPAPNLRIGGLPYVHPNSAERTF